jgi:hypothetical protein
MLLTLLLLLGASPWCLTLLLLIAAGPECLTLLLLLLLLLFCSTEASCCKHPSGRRRLFGGSEG